MSPDNLVLSRVTKRQGPRHDLYRLLRGALDLGQLPRLLVAGLLVLAPQRVDLG